MTAWFAGFLAAPDVQTALVVGTAVAVVSALVGVMVVVRGQAFVGHALGDMGATGAAGAYLAGIDALWGFLASGLVAGLAVDGLSRRSRARDVMTGIVLAFMLGLGALLLYFTTQATGTSDAPVDILFGSIFTVTGSEVPAVLGFSACALALVGALYRPLLFTSLGPDVARARGVPTRLVGLLFMLAIVIAVEQSALVAGALLSTALLIGPAATAVSLTRRVGPALGTACALGVATVWLGIALAYASYLWPPRGQGWPVSFFIASLVLVGYLAARFTTRRRPARGAAAREA